MTDHDRLFKELLSTFFMEFLELFLPDIDSAIDPDSVVFLPQEYFADLTTGEQKIIDLLAQVQLAGQEVRFLIHIEAQATSKPEFSRRMFFYFARLHQKYLQRIFPIVIFPFDEPQREEPNPLFKYFKPWCQDENRHGDIFKSLLRSQPKFWNTWKSRLWSRFFLLTVFATHTLTVHERANFYTTLGLDATAFDADVIRKTNETAARAFPMVLDTEHPQFFA